MHLPATPGERFAVRRRSSGYPISCTECRRRKQKCNREWPCDQCQQRRVIEKCTFDRRRSIRDLASYSAEASRAQDAHSRLNPGESFSDLHEEQQQPDVEGIDGDAPLVAPGFGFTAEPPSPGQHAAHIGASPQLQRALALLSPRLHVDLLARHFITTVNFDYYAIYPPEFLRDYQTWWAQWGWSAPVDLAWTSLLLLICACSILHADPDLAESLQYRFGQDTKDLADRYYNAARELHGTIPVAQGHICTVQYLLLSCYWYKSQACFVECWITLGSAVREAQNLGLHRNIKSGDTSEFDREMRARLWCLLDSSDWMLSTVLQRPMLIDRSDCTVGLPALTLEAYPISPLLQIKLQCQVIAQVFQRFTSPKNIVTVADVNDYIHIVETWMGTFPPKFYLNNPDTASDGEYPWIAFQRQYLHAAALSMAVAPLKRFMIIPMARSVTSKIELDFRDRAVHYALKLIDALHQSFKCMEKRHTTYELLPFSVLEAGGLLCSCVQQDRDNSAPCRPAMMDSIGLAMHLLERMSAATPVAKKPYDVLRQLHAGLQKALATQDERRAEEQTALASGIASQGDLGMPKTEVLTQENKYHVANPGVFETDQGQFVQDPTKSSASYMTPDHTAPQFTAGQTAAAQIPSDYPNPYIPVDRSWNEATFHASAHDPAPLQAALLSIIQGGSAAPAVGMFPAEPPRQPPQEQGYVTNTAHDVRPDQNI